MKAAFSGRPLYQEIVNRAKRAGLVNAVAHHTHYGFSNHGHVQAREVEGMNSELAMCVEMIGPKATLENFCRAHGDLLIDKVMVYKHLERWKLGMTAPGRAELTEADVSTIEDMDSE